MNAAKAKWNATANARARMAAKAANLAARTGTAAKGIVSKLQNMRRPAPTGNPNNNAKLRAAFAGANAAAAAAVTANQKVEKAASEAVKVNNQAAMNPTVTNMTKASNANKKLNTAVVNAMRVNKKL